ncbi:MAG: hypothetical protein ACRELC_09120 [Gemmatimonadota bacterium]
MRRSCGSRALHLSLLLLVLGLAPPATAQMSPEQAIANALSAAPPAIAANAAVHDWEGNVLREGSSEWTCLPDVPDSPGNDPMCLDAPWLAWAEAWMGHTEPAITRIGIGYMLQGGAPDSNTDPYAEGPTADNEWMEEGVPHLMMVVPDEAWLEGLPTSPEGGGPWVMWRVTPYVHLMVPTTKAPG